MRNEEKLIKEDFFSPTDIYQKSNVLISAKYKSTILENKVMAIILSQINNAKEDKEGSLVVNIPASYLREKLDVKGGSFYSHLERVAASMTGRVVGMSDKESQKFLFVPLISLAKYSDGVFTCRFVPEMKKHLTSLKANFTQMHLSQTLSFKYNASLRLYEILKSYCYQPKKMQGSYIKDKYEIHLSVSELKLEMGVINPAVGSVQTILTETGLRGIPDYDRAVESAKDQMYLQFGEFRRACLDKAITEINKKTEMQVELVAHRSGKGRTIQDITFLVKIDKDKFKSKMESEEESIDIEPSQAEKDECIDFVIDLIEEKIKATQARSICEAALYNRDKIRKAYFLFEKHG